MGKELAFDHPRQLHRTFVTVDPDPKAQLNLAWIESPQVFHSMGIITIGWAPALSPSRKENDTKKKRKSNFHAFLLPRQYARTRLTVILVYKKHGLSFTEKSESDMTRQCLCFRAFMAQSQHYHLASKSKLTCDLSVVTDSIGGLFWSRKHRLCSLNFWMKKESRGASFLKKKARYLSVWTTYRRGPLKKITTWPLLILATTKIKVLI